MEQSEVTKQDIDEIRPKAEEFLNKVEELSALKIIRPQISSKQ